MKKNRSIYASLHSDSFDHLRHHATGYASLLFVRISLKITAISEQNPVQIGSSFVPRFLIAQTAVFDRI